jgi:hypothetical protein
MTAHGIDDVDQPPLQPERVIGKEDAHFQLASSVRTVRRLDLGVEQRPGPEQLGRDAARLVDRRGLVHGHDIVVDGLDVDVVRARRQMQVEDVLDRPGLSDGRDVRQRGVRQIDLSR